MEKIEKQEHINQTDLFTQNLKEIYDDFQVILPYEQKITSKKTNKNLSCDLMIVLDCTGSMQSWISACKQNILKIIENVKQQFQGSELRVGMVAYRDHCDTKRLEIYPFVNKDYEALQTFISRLSATGGGDEPEDLAGALEASINQFEWKSDAKTMIIITDAPCHGSAYHDCSDHYSTGDPYGIDIEEYIYIIGKKGIDLNVIDIQKNTNKMYEVFEKVYSDARGKPIQRLKLGQNTIEFGKQITQTVASTITCSTQKSHQGDEMYKKAFRILRAQKGLLNTNCLSKTELKLMQKTNGKSTIADTKIDKEQKQIIEEENEELSSDEEEEEEKKNNDNENDNDDSNQGSDKKRKKSTQDENDEQDETELKNKEKQELLKIKWQWELKKNGIECNTEAVVEPIVIKNKQQTQQDSKYRPTIMLERINWETDFNTQQSFNLSCNCLTPYVDKRQEVNWNNPVVKVQQLTSKIKVMKQFFAEGAMRHAFFAYDSVLNLKLVAKLHKDMKNNSNFELMKRDSMSLIACHYFAEEFNSRILLLSDFDKKQQSILLNFVNSTIYEVIGHVNKEIKYYFVENFIEGEYQKYNNNAGWTNQVSSTEFNQISQAFSHFTWQYSKGQLLVVDIQGGQNGILTDPQIHTKNRSKLYGQGDLGYEGMMRFFYTHEYLIHPKKLGQLPAKFDFFNDLFGLDVIPVEQEKKVEPIIVSGATSDKQDEKHDLLFEEELTNKKKKKKRGMGYNKVLQEQQKQLEDLKLAAFKKAEEEQKVQAAKELESKDDRQVGTQCSLCKKCFQAARSVVIFNRKNKNETFCDYCELQNSLSKLDLSCMQCGILFQISKYYCKVKKINLIGKCIKCRE